MITWVAILFAAGLILIFAEAFLPGGVCGFFGVLAMLTSCVLGCMNYPEYAVLIIAVELGAALAGLLLGLKVLPHTSMGRALVHGARQKPSEGWVADASDESLEGKEGEAHTQLRPSGLVTIDGRRINAVSEGAFIEKGARVRVKESRGNRVVVEVVEDGGSPKGKIES